MSASSSSCRVSCLNHLTELARLNETIHQFIDPLPIALPCRHAVDLAIEELVTNIIKYGYDDVAEHTIQVSLDLRPDHLVLTIEDDGHAFNPLERAAPDTTKPLEEREIGGLGLHLVRKSSERMEYRREGDRNIVTVHIRRNASA